MKIYTLVKIEGADIGVVEMNTYPIFSTADIEEAKDRMKEEVRRFYDESLCDNPEYLDECDERPHLSDFNELYKVKSARNGTLWRYTTGEETILFDIMTTELNIE